MACPDKGIPHSARILASDKDSHSINAPAIISEHNRHPIIASVSLVLSFMVFPLFNLNSWWPSVAVVGVVKTVDQSKRRCA
jgi:hypothetical protein